MKYQATQTFEGILSMEVGEVRELDSNQLIVKDLLEAGFIKPVKAEKKEEKGE